MKIMNYNDTTDDFTVTLTPEELETINAWLQESRRGIELRMKDKGFAPLEMDRRLINLKMTLDQMNFLLKKRNDVLENK